MRKARFPVASTFRPIDCLAWDLPSLNEAFPSFKGFESTENRQEVLIRMFRDWITDLQRADPRPFYSMREISTYFSVSLRTAAIVFERLEREGLLYRIRGSKTMLAGKSARRCRPVKGVVGIPLSLASMITSPFEESLQRDLDERLCANGYVADTIFFRSGEDCEPDFADRLLDHHLDIVIWPWPNPLSSQVRLSLRERGIRLIVLRSDEAPSATSVSTYLLDWEPAYRAMARTWKTEGITRVIIPKPSHPVSQPALQTFIAVLQAQRLNVHVVESSDDAVTVALSISGFNRQKSDVLAFADSETADQFCRRSPHILESVSIRARLAFCRGPVSTAPFKAHNLHADLIQLCPNVISTRIVKDLCLGSHRYDSVCATFEAKYYPRVKL
jgi:uncharacterized protein (UPF0212 family)